jgi:hypothetical protein
MKIKNCTTKAIGFGGVTIMPEMTGDTPKGYEKGHPVVDYYLSRKWIKEVGASKDDGKPATGTTGGTEKPLDRMNKDELTALAAEMGVEVAEADTRQQILDKVKAAKKASE